MGLFNTFRFETPENVELEFTLAGLGNRVYALVIDYLILAVVQIVYILLITSFSETIVSLFGNKLGENVALWIFAILTLVNFFIYMGYFAFFETLWQGQTPGKRFVKIRVIRDDGRRVRLPQASLRALLRPLDDFLGLGIFCIFFSKSEKRLGDWVAGTLVIQEDSPLGTANFSLSQAAEALAIQLQSEADILSLRAEDFAVIRSYLQRRAEMNPEARIELSRSLAHQVREIISWSSIPEGVTPTLFLEAVYLAYQKQGREF